MNIIITPVLKVHSFVQYSSYIDQWCSIVYMFEKIMAGTRGEMRS
jgi:hypothetical protein